MIILGSQSPRRKEILNFFSIPFTQVASHFDEASIPMHSDPASYAKLLATKKAEVLQEQFKNKIILCADTVVYHQKKIYNKPSDKKEAKQFLSELSGSWHEVITALCVVFGDKIICEVETTQILFNPLSEDQIESYLSHFAFSDKAGGYAIQQGGGIIVKKIEGCYYNVMGLPINTLAKVLKEVDIDLWKHLKIF
ncbi:MAG: septum formation protein Maf [Chlamydiae bacterium]|nr:septum formation protein Maf [Chlamydiota bacterium]